MNVRSEPLNVRSKPLNVRSEPLNVRSKTLNWDLMPFEWKFTTRGKTIYNLQKTIRPVWLKLPNTPFTFSFGRWPLVQPVLLESFWIFWASTRTGRNILLYSSNYSLLFGELSSCLWSRKNRVYANKENVCVSFFLKKTYFCLPIINNVLSLHWK